MRVLILSCNTGEGHNACGKAIRQCFREKNIPCDMQDAFQFISQDLSRFVSANFVRIYRHFPELFRIGYNYTERHPSVLDENSGVAKMLALGAERLFRFLYSGGYDTIVCTHIFAALMVQDVQRRYPTFQAHTSFFPTDYTCYPGCEQCNLDMIFLPARDLVPTYVRRGFAEERLVPSGIPIRLEFYQKLDKLEARRRLGIPADCRHLMVMCGSMGCGPLRKIAKMIQQRLPANCLVSIICGTNRKLYRKLSVAFAGDDRFAIHAFVKDISTLMDSADLYLTKPGGLSVTEASHKRLPMAFVNAVEGCEAYNRQFFLQRGMAVSADTLPALASMTVSLLYDDAALASMAAAQAVHFPGNATEQVVNALIDAQQPAAQP